MSAPRSQLDRFVAALHRRLLVIRALESTALGTAAGCAVAAALIPLLFWRGLPAVAPVGSALLLGATAGLLWGVTRRPSRFQAAAEADRQLSLADLLATALAVRGAGRDSDQDDGAAPWLRTVQYLADDACARHTPSEVIFRRLHGRAWGGVALAAALVLSVAALTAPEPAARAASNGTGPGMSQRSRAGVVEQDERNAGRRTGGPRASRSPGTGPERDGDGAQTPLTDKSDGESGTPALDSAKSGTPGDAGQGGGTARARARPADEQTPPAAGDATPGAAPSPKGETAAGPGPATTRGAGQGAAPTATVGPAPAAASPTPPWQSPTWADDTRRAREDLDSRRVPDSRRDLVREYFERR